MRKIHNLHLWNSTCEIVWLLR